MKPILQKVFLTLLVEVYFAVEAIYWLEYLLWRQKNRYFFANTLLRLGSKYGRTVKKIRFFILLLFNLDLCESMCQICSISNENKKYKNTAAENVPSPFNKKWYRYVPWWRQRCSLPSSTWQTEQKNIMKTLTNNSTGSKFTNLDPWWAE